jgi:hypothetical protein
MTSSDGKGRPDQKLTPDLWRGAYEHMRAHPHLAKLLPLLHARQRARCARFLSGHRVGSLVDQDDLFGEVIIKLISCPTIASRKEIARFFAENEVEMVIERMACWSTSRLPLLGLSQKIAGRRWEQPGSVALGEVEDRQPSACTDRPVRVSQLTQYLEVYQRELFGRLEAADFEARLALSQILVLLGQNGLDRSDEPESGLGMFDELPFGAIRDLVNEKEEPPWEYETARKACQRLATADRAIRRDAERDGFGTGAAALQGYLRHRIKTQSQGGGGNVAPPVGEETKS